MKQDLHLIEHLARQAEQIARDAAHINSYYRALGRADTAPKIRHLVDLKEHQRTSKN